MGLATTRSKLLDFDGGASVDKLLLDGSSFVLADTFLGGLRCAVDEVLGFFEAEAGDFTNNLDDIDLVRARASEDNVEFRLFFSRCSSGSSGSATTSNRDGRGG